MPKPLTTRLVEWAVAGIFLVPLVVLGGLTLAGEFGDWPRMIIAVPMAVLYAVGLTYGTFRFMQHFREGWREGGQARHKHG